MTGVSRAGFYRSRLPHLATPVEMEIRDEMQKIAVESPAYGYRRITVELQRRGFDINHKRVLRMMREDNLLCVRRSRFVVTTDSRHNLPIYPNLASQMAPTAINQLWVADITYIRLRTEFVYLAVVLDAFSRRVVGWALGRTLEAELVVAALRMAVVTRKPQPGLAHHSDRGVQYTQMLKEHLAQISMSRKGNLYDNAACESGNVFNMLGVHQNDSNAMPGQNVIEGDGADPGGLHRHRIDPTGAEPRRHPFQIGRPATEFLHWMGVPVRRDGYKMALIAYVNPAGMGMDNRQTGIVGCQSPR